MIVDVQTSVERILRHDRALLAVTVAIVTIACWSWIVPMARDMYGPMSGASAWMMTATWDTPHLALLAGMWIAMMAGMMLPSAAPMLLLYAGAARRRGAGGAVVMRPVYAMAAGYLTVWVGFSVGATLLQRLLTTLLLLTPMMEPRTPWLSGVLLVGAGIYQFTPFKRACLASCQAPVAFLMRRWRNGAAGAFRMGLEHGWFCVGCCWALMLLLFAGGVMSLGVIAALTALVTVERLAGFGVRVARAAGVALIAAGVWVVVRR